MKRLFAAVVLFLAAFVVIPSQTSSEAAQPAAAVPTPTTVAGFEEMFNRVDPNLWGGGDVSTSVKIADGRTVWLYADTFSRKHYMVNSSALVQTGGSLHVANGGAQILPQADDKDGRKVVYWLETAKSAGGNRIHVTVAPTSIGTQGPWDFRRATAKSRTAVLTVTKAGDVRFAGWTGWVAEPHVEQDLLGAKQGVPAELTADKAAVFYRKNTHPQFTLDNGKKLTTICQNRTDGDLSDLSDYRPLFIASA